MVCATCGSEDVADVETLWRGSYSGLPHDKGCTPPHLFRNEPNALKWLCPLYSHERRNWLSSSRELTEVSWMKIPTSRWKFLDLEYPDSCLGKTRIVPDVMTLRSTYHIGRFNWSHIKGWVGGIDG